VAEALRIEVFGVVQGVGFRPYVFRLARRFGLKGWVKNDARGVEIHLEGPSDDLVRFVETLPAELPSLARIERLTHRRLAVFGFKDFRVRGAGRPGRVVVI
jgi:hydrogenase maturation protein HypF